MKTQTIKTCLRAQWPLLSVLALLLAWQVLFSIGSKALLAPPLNAPITLSPNGSTTALARVRLAETYHLRLIFDTTGHDRQALGELVGDVWRTPSGVQVPIRWSLADAQTGAVAASGEIDSFGAAGWSQNEIERHLSTLRVAPGNYRFHAQILRDVPEFAQVKAHFSMQLRPKMASAWQITALWWGSLASYLLVWPAIVIVVLRLGCRVSSGKR